MEQAMAIKFPNLIILCLAILFVSCSSSRNASNSNKPGNNTTEVRVTPNLKAKTFVEPIAVNRGEVIKYAKSLLGTPYKYASAEPKKGLDCSGFIYHVLGKFNISSPRSSKDFTNEGREVKLKDARPGDLILFTGSNHASGIVGHMGFVTENKNGKLFFIHSASGKNIGVIINEFRGYYSDHFVKVISIFE